MLATLSTAHKIGLGLSGLAFVAFALVTSMLVPRWRPDFPGRRKPLYLVFCFLFFVGMMLAVIVFGKEEPEPANPEAAPIAALYR